MPIMHYTCNASFLLVITRIIPLHGIVCCTSSDSARRCLSLPGPSTCPLCPGRKWRYPPSRRRVLCHSGGPASGALSRLCDTRCREAPEAGRPRTARQHFPAITAPRGGSGRCAAGHAASWRGHGIRADTTRGADITHSADTSHI